jgi:hypothetical protein
MKNFFKYALVLAMLCMPVVMNADDVDMLTKNKALSASYKGKIKVISHEIKALKAKLKVDDTDVKTHAELEQKKAEMKDLKEKKEIVDDAIKTEKASIKAAKAAEKAKLKAAKAAEKAGALHAPSTN